LEVVRYVSGKINNKSFRLHRYIIKASEEDKIVDHINNDKLDNRLENLLDTTPSLNNHNKSKKSNVLLSKYTGISRKSYSLKDGTIVTKFYALIFKDKQRYYLGTFNSEIEATKAYNKKAIELYSEKYASLNQV